MYDSVNEDELSEWTPRDSEDSSQAQLALGNREPARRGSPRVDEAWTRVIRVVTDEQVRIRTWAISTELQLAQGLPVRVRRRDRQPWALLFDPKAFRDQSERLVLEDFKLERPELLEAGGHVTALRTTLRQRALEFEHRRAETAQVDVLDLSKLAKKVDKGYFPACHDLRDRESLGYSRETSWG